MRRSCDNAAHGDPAGEADGPQRSSSEPSLKYTPRAPNVLKGVGRYHADQPELCHPMSVACILGTYPCVLCPGIVAIHMIAWAGLGCYVISVRTQHLPACQPSRSFHSAPGIPGVLFYLSSS